MQFMQCMPSAIQAVAVTGYAASAARFHSMAEQLSLQYISVPKISVSNLHAMTYKTICCTGATHTFNCDKHAVASSRKCTGVDFAVATLLSSLCASCACMAWDAAHQSGVTTNLPVRCAQYTWGTNRVSLASNLSRRTVAVNIGARLVSETFTCNSCETLCLEAQHSTAQHSTAQHVTAAPSSAKPENKHTHHDVCTHGIKSQRTQQMAAKACKPFQCH